MWDIVLSGLQRKVKSRVVMKDQFLNVQYEWCALCSPAYVLQLLVAEQQGGAQLLHLLHPLLVLSCVHLQCVLMNKDTSFSASLHTTFKVNILQLSTSANQL